MNLVLIGYRGTGKSDVARVLAARLGWPWFDADERIEALTGKSIAEIFAQDGEPVFRNWETRVVGELSERPDAVLALGGGAVLRSANREAILRQGRIVWLTASPATILRRVEADPATAARRPKLTMQGGITEIIATLADRNPVYRQCAHLEVDTEDKTVEQVADAILEQLNLDS